MKYEMLAKDKKCWLILVALGFLGILPFSGCVKTKVVKIVPPGGTSRMTSVMSPLPKNFPTLSVDFLHMERDSFHNLSEKLPATVSSQLFQEMSLKINRNSAPKSYQTKEMLAKLKSEQTLQEMIDRQEIPPIHDSKDEISTFRTNLEIRNLKRKKKTTDTEIPEMIREILFYIYCDRKLTLRQFKEKDRVLYKSLMTWSLKNQAKLWVAVKEVAEEWLRRPPNSHSSNHQFWNRVPRGFPAYFQKEVGMSVLEESFKLHPSPEEDLKSYLLHPLSNPLTPSIFAKEKLPPILRTSSILFWNLSKKEYEQRIEVATQTSSSSTSPLSYQYFNAVGPGSFFSPSLRREDVRNGEEFGRWMIDESEELFLANQLSATDDFFTVL